jgi:hypothetical protein
MRARKKGLRLSADKLALVSALLAVLLLLAATFFQRA